MAKFGYNGNTIRIQRNVYFISGNMQGKYKKLPLYCNELIPKRENFVFGKTYLEACNFIKKEILAQVFPYEFCEISKNTFFTQHLQTTVSEQKKFLD